jgi:KUP system potassium uptake protein
VIEDLVASGEINLDSSFDSMKKHGFQGDFKYVFIERIMLRDYKLTKTENFILALHRIIRYLGIPDVRALQLDSTNTIVEQVPIIVDQPVEKRIARL